MPASGHQRDIKRFTKRTIQKILTIDSNATVKAEMLYCGRSNFIAASVWQNFMLFVPQLGFKHFYVTLNTGKTSQAPLDADQNGITGVQHHCLFAQSQNSTGAKCKY